MSEITLKLKYQTENSPRILEMIKNYNSIFNLTYNFMFENHLGSRCHLTGMPSPLPCLEQ